MNGVRAMNGYPKRQRGFSLLVVLILLVVMSVLGVAVLRSSAMQERMASNLRDRSLVNQAVENALASAQGVLGASTTWQTTVPNATTCASDSVCPSYTKATAATWKTGPTLKDVPTQYWVEYLGENQAYQESGGVYPNPTTVQTGPLFRITARSNATGRANVILQTDVMYRMPRL